MSWLYKPAITMGPLPGRHSAEGSVNGVYAYGLGFMLGLNDGKINKLSLKY